MVSNPGPMSFTARRPVGLALSLALSLACAGPAAIPPSLPAPELPHPGSPIESPSVVLERFIEAVESGRWAQASSLLSARWRAAYTPARLAADYAGGGPLAREAVARARAALRAGTALEVEGKRAVLPVDGGRALLLAEAGGWRVDAFE